MAARAGPRGHHSNVPRGSILSVICVLLCVGLHSLKVILARVPDVGMHPALLTWDAMGSPV